MTRRIIIFVSAVALAAVLAMPRLDRSERGNEPRIEPKAALTSDRPDVLYYASQAAATLHDATTWSRQTVGRVRRKARNLAHRAHLL